ncbi:hypothetical protein [Coleofasciculus sp.]|uniref:hypothetical protein n=1 Tax=Coleofasciculus sp. TaxID=3100458 RepID=UPI0039F7FC98
MNLTPGTVYVQDYQSHQLSSLYTLDLVTGNARLIGAIATSVADLAFIDSQLYGLDQTDDGQTTLLLNINPTTGEATVIGDVGFAVTRLAYNRQKLLATCDLDTGEINTIGYGLLEQSQAMAEKLY